MDMRNNTLRVTIYFTLQYFSSGLQTLRRVKELTERSREKEVGEEGMREREGEREKEHAASLQQPHSSPPPSVEQQQQQPEDLNRGERVRPSVQAGFVPVCAGRGRPARTQEAKEDTRRQKEDLSFGESREEREQSRDGLCATAGRLRLTCARVPSHRGVQKVREVLSAARRSQPVLEARC